MLEVHVAQLKLWVDTIRSNSHKMLFRGERLLLVIQCQSMAFVITESGDSGWVTFVYTSTLCSKTEV